LALKEVKTALSSPFPFEVMNVHQIYLQNSKGLLESVPLGLADASEKAAFQTLEAVGTLQAELVFKAKGARRRKA
jgi:hypothetical protein